MNIKEHDIVIITVPNGKYRGYVLALRGDSAEIYVPPRGNDPGHDMVARLEDVSPPPTAAEYHVAVQALDESGFEFVGVREASNVPEDADFGIHYVHRTDGRDFYLNYKTIDQAPKWTAP